MIRDSYEKLKQEIGDQAKLIAVTKYHSAEDALAAYDAGVRHFGENRIEGFLEKREALPEDAEVHFIGTLQSRKVKDIIDHLNYVHSLDRMSVAKKIEQYSSHTVKCFIQVNVSGESSKHGLSPEEVPGFLDDMRAYSRIRIIGLMTMAPHTEDEAEIAWVFEQLRILKDSLKEKNSGNIQVEELSMGMSNDYHVALRHGATYVRIGSKLMGSR
ncbi:YggS family pyridoxal phosphate-dependent enzyme [Salinicoccus hispanicus]|uniref:Pyridoxal phosphate homeostasis protein n=1 Tax=Salinicoccus hispanicus TaxID=157225 RepID=A0A6N8TVR2_9STAP|nr:YggS family pyridoxal phosphate-dependent enzyme [Salinicoccus hispanicus]MXQ49803.1 YggS family pyridoxal phosphate-dependent enzyme [Salinicoccus hispanicus]